MKKIILLSIGLFLHLSSVGVDTTFINTYGGLRYDEGKSVRSTMDGGIIMAGSTGSFGFGDADMYIVKVDSDANFLWSKSYGGLFTENCQSILETADTGFIMVGYTNSFGAGQYDVYVVKTDSIGDTLWTKTFGGAGWDFGYDVIQSMDGNYIVIGETYSTISGDNDVFVVKLDVNGNVVWTNNYGGPQQDFGRSIIELYDSTLLIAGGTSSIGTGGLDVLLLKLSAQGDSLWAQAHGGAEDDWARDVIITADSGISTIGTTKSFNTEYKEMYHIKTNSSGTNIVFQGNWGQIHDQEGFELIQISNGNYQLFGYVDNGGGLGNDFILQTVDGGGGFITGYTFGYNGDEDGVSFDRTPSNGLVLFGTTDSKGAGLSDFLLIKADSLGKDINGAFFNFGSPPTTYTDTSIQPAPVKVTEIISNEGKLLIYPIPISDIVTIDMTDFANVTDQLTFILFNNMGQVVMNQLINGNSMTFSREGLTDGMYNFVVLHETSDGLKRYTRKLLIIGK